MKEGRRERGQPGLHSESGYIACIKNNFEKGLVE
jgi:hypothetical protein